MLTELEKALLKKVDELDAKSKFANDCYKWWQEEKAKVAELEKKLKGADKVQEILEEV